MEQIDKKLAADILIKFPKEMAADVFRLMSPEISVNIIDQVPVDDAADIITLLNEAERSEVLGKINPELEKVIDDLMHYKEDTVGSVMSTYYIAVREGTTVGETLKAMKDAPTQIQNRAYVYVVDKKGRPQSAVSM
jgi:magnesium transporter